MHSASKSVVEFPVAVPAKELRFLIEPEPWLTVFSRNIGDLFRPEPPKVWLTSPAAEYWPDALVNRPVAWTQMRQSFLGHVLVAVSIYAVTLSWIDRPHVLPEEVPHTTITHYQLSEYLPSVNTQAKKIAPAVRHRAQKADPEYAPQEIVSIQENHSSLRQTIAQLNPNLLPRDVPIPNMVISSTIPGAPVVARHSIQSLNLPAPQVVPPSQQSAERSISRLTFPMPAPPVVVPPPEGISARSPKRPSIPLPQPQVVPPSQASASRHPAPVLPLSGVVVVPPSQTVVARNAARLSIPVQAPEIAAPASSIARRPTLTAQLPVAQPQAVPPPESTTHRNLAAITMNPQSQTIVPPTPPVAAGAAPANEKAIGQLLALSIQPVAPSGPISVPEGTRQGEFAASPEGHPGASARPEIKVGVPADAARIAATSSPSNIFVAPPPNKIIASSVVASPPPAVSSPPPADVPSSDRIDNQVFGARKHYSMRLSMPNLNSRTGSWIIRFAELHSPGSAAQEDLSAPEPIRKVDPAYPASMVADRVEGVVVLYAVIRSDGTVSEVRVLEGFDERLDENARAALAQWVFRPGTKNGVPVDIEAVVRVPFRGSKPRF